LGDLCLSPNYLRDAISAVLLSKVRLTISIRRRVMTWLADWPTTGNGILIGLPTYLCPRRLQSVQTERSSATGIPSLSVTTSRMYIGLLVSLYWLWVP